MLGTYAALTRALVTFSRACEYARWSGFDGNSEKWESAGPADGRRPELGYDFECAHAARGGGARVEGGQHAGERLEGAAVDQAPRGALVRLEERHDAGGRQRTHVGVRGPAEQLGESEARAGRGEIVQELVIRIHERRRQRGEALELRRAVLLDRPCRAASIIMHETNAMKFENFDIL
jgi:hypothetical protein